jgi:hypothetical protein
MKVHMFVRCVQPNSVGFGSIDPDDDILTTVKFRVHPCLQNHMAAQVSKQDLVNEPSIVVDLLRPCPVLLQFLARTCFEAYLSYQILLSGRSAHKHHLKLISIHSFLCYPRQDGRIPSIASTQTTTKMT